MNKNTTNKSCGCPCSRMYGPQGNNEAIRRQNEKVVKLEESLGRTMTEFEKFLYLVFGTLPVNKTPESG